VIGATSDTPNVVDLETGAIVDVALNRGDQHGLAARVVAAAARRCATGGWRSSRRRRGARCGERSGRPGAPAAGR